MPRRMGHPKENKPWDRENWSTRKRRTRIGRVKDSAKWRKKREN